jgi:hypothetical protein
VSSFGSQVGAVVNKTNLGAMTKGLGGKLMGVLGGMGSAVMAGIGMAPDFLKDQIEQIKSLNKVGLKADALGVKSDDYMSLTNNAKRFGMEQEDVNKALFKVGSMKGVPPGINPDDWLKADGVTRLKLFGDSLGQLDSTGEKMERVKDVFGKMGATMMPVLSQGSKGIEEFTRKQREMGLLLSPQQMAGVMKARTALPKFDAIFDGFKLQMTAGIAPLVEVFGNVLSKAQPFVMKIVSIATELVSTWYTVVAGMWEGIFGFIGDSFDQIFVQTGALKSAIEAFGLEGLNVGDQFKAVLWGIAKGFAYVWDTIKTGVAVSFVEPLGLSFVLVGEAMEKLGIKGGKALKEAGTGMGAWALNNVTNWGATKDKVDAFFIDMISKQVRVGQQAEETAQTIKAAYSAVGASIMGSKEAVGIEARFKTEGMLDPFRKAQKEANKDVVNAIKDLDRNLMNELRRKAFGDPFPEL